MLKPVSISNNLSAKDMENPDISAFILEQLSLHGGHNLIFEITETESIQDYSKVKQFVEGVRARNSKIAIDDFGSGYSNDSYLIEIQPDLIKVDGSIISRILDDEKSRLITESIVEFAHKIDAKVVAEFVCNEEIADVLRDMNVDFFRVSISESQKCFRICPTSMNGKQGACAPCSDSSTHPSNPLSAIYTPARAIRR
ncbi:MAG: EAL domain-containing protein [Marinobacter sp.]|uniref:EAL domain-containing protein n=1 Tax=Marinobacter sp. TaxID=50741 RepID=UPI00396F1941